MSRRSSQAVHRPRLSIGVLLATAVVMGVAGVAVALSPAARGADPTPAPQAAELTAMLECDERSLTKDGEVMYSITDPPDYPEEYTSEVGPESVAESFAAAQRLASPVSVQAATYRTAERVDFPLAARDGRVVGIATAVNEGGWRQGGGVVCGGE